MTPEQRALYDLMGRLDAEARSLREQADRAWDPVRGGDRRRARDLLRRRDDVLARKLVVGRDPAWRNP
jgi:hypothetical protein